MQPGDAAFSPSRRLTHFLAQGFGAGRIPFAPGTFGTLVGIPFYIVLSELGPWFYTVSVVLLFALGVWLAEVTGRDLGAHDHQTIVWDEVVGFLITMFLAPPGWAWIVAGFVLFRLFDIWKPYPIRLIDRRLANGLGCMLDDVLAGVYALAVLQGAHYLYRLPHG
ncbi:MAG: phosphatidylglycerophosphatase A [Gammaproteobacteria bacterium]|nr:MAG: phosphatidylglycerophosphatase A [Gammaproteobacteria bacterium]